MWILDSKSEIGKMSPIQVAILFEYAKLKKKPLMIVDLIKSLNIYFENLWKPKKGTIYPSVHNLNVRGYLKMHTIQPYGYSITDRGLEAVEKIMKNFNDQFEVYLHFNEFILTNFSQIKNKPFGDVLNKHFELIDNYRTQIKKWQMKLHKVIK